MLVDRGGEVGPAPAGDRRLPRLAQNRRPDWTSAPSGRRRRARPPQDAVQDRRAVPEAVREGLDGRALAADDDARSAGAGHLDHLLDAGHRRVPGDDDPDDAERLAHHSLGTDNGSAFTSRAFRARLGEQGVRHRRGGYRDPESQAFIESWFGKLKEREVWLNEYETLDDARRGIGGYVDRYHHRPHSGLGYRTPLEVRQTWEDLQNIAA